MFAGTECEQVQVKRLGFGVGFALKRSIKKGCLCLAPAAGLWVSSWVHAWTLLGAALSLSRRWDCSTGNVLERLGGENSGLNLTAAHQPPRSHVVPQVSFPCLPKRGVQTVFSFPYVALPFYSDVSAFLFIPYHIRC